MAIGKRAPIVWKAAGLTPITFHECRHTFASLLIDAGANPKAIQTFMGHSKIQTTFDTYGHLMPGSHDEVRELMDAYLSGLGTRLDARLTSDWRTDWRTGGQSGLAHSHRSSRFRLFKPQTKRPALGGASLGTGRRYVFLEVGRRYQALRGKLNRVEAVSATCATPMPTKRITGAQAPVIAPVTRPVTAAKPASA